MADQERDPFVPPDGLPVSVKWRREGKRFVVDEITFPF